MGIKHNESEADRKRKNEQIEAQRESKTRVREQRKVSLISRGGRRNGRQRDSGYQ